MDNSLLPIKVCENIMDSCDWSFVDYTTLRSCALTCTAWLPRTRLNLYHSVKLIGPRKLELLLRTLRAHRYLCSFVRDLEVGSSAEQPYVPFAQLFIVQNLRHLERLTLWLDWDGYPPHFHKFVAQLRLRALRLFGIFRTTRSLLQLVWALKDLRSLVVDCTVRSDVCGAEWAIGRSRRLSLCSSLTDLSLRFSVSANRSFVVAIISDAVPGLKTHCQLPPTRWIRPRSRSSPVALRPRTLTRRSFW